MSESLLESLYPTTTLCGYDALSYIPFGGGFQGCTTSDPFHVITPCKDDNKVIVVVDFYLPPIDNPYLCHNAGGGAVDSDVANGNRIGTTGQSWTKDEKKKNKGTESY